MQPPMFVIAHRTLAVNTPLDRVGERNCDQNCVRITHVAGLSCAME
jgi:hypothetical protein